MREEKREREERKKRSTEKGTKRQRGRQKSERTLRVAVAERHKQSHT